MSDLLVDPLLVCVPSGQSDHSVASEVVAVANCLDADAAAVEDVRLRMLSAGAAQWNSGAGEEFRACLSRRAGELAAMAEELRTVALWLNNNATSLLSVPSPGLGK